MGLWLAHVGPRSQALVSVGCPWDSQAGFRHVCLSSQQGVSGEAGGRSGSLLPGCPSGCPSPPWLPLT